MISEDGNIDYSAYSVRELQEARSSISPEKYPENYSNLISEFDRRDLKYSEPVSVQEAEPQTSSKVSSRQVKSPIATRLTGLVTMVFGVVWFLLKYEDGVYHGRRFELTFADDPFLISYYFFIHAVLVVIGLLGLVFGPGFYRVLSKGQSKSSEL